MSGYQDTGIATLWDVKDEITVDKILWKIRNNDVPADTFEQKVMRHYNDQTTDIEPLEVSEPKNDLVVNDGLGRIAQLLVGATNAVFNSFASGTGDAPERPSDHKLSAENWRVSMISSGYMQAVGITIRYAGKFPSTVATGTITEGGIFDSGATNQGVMLLRTVYREGSRIEHTANRTFYSLLHSINQISVT